MGKDIKQMILEIKKHPYIAIGGVVIALVFFTAVAAPLLTKFNPLEVNGKDRLLPPSLIHPMGTDHFGRDVMSRLVYGARISMQIGISVVVLSTLMGGLIGLVAGYYHKFDNFIMRILDGFMAFPGIIIAIILAAVWGAGKLNIILALSFAYFPQMARVVRGCVLTGKEWECVESAKSSGARDGHILFRYILLNSLSPIIVQATFTFAVAILDEAALSFLGMGIEPPHPSWGGMITEGRSFMSIAPWEMIFPGAAIMVTVLGLNLLGDGLRDYLDPRLKV
ncbi:ABC transporter permease [Fusobacteria bacterium ZRK30]|nr:ABC transporter permease [Fusobacteria bacterium ZRK30]